MKIRTGFVSNSSSSSFCIIGFEAIDMEEDYEERFYIHELGSGKIIVGEKLIRASEYDFDSIPFSDVVKAYTKIKVRFPDKDIRIFAGSDYS